ncbi:MAG: hypothetical protein EOP48_12715 [Sphingobacteriales bacterium]|nr:MAG: hypothetical protein EOP48_12715 [Sphingobacteriales bacterium]
MTLSSEYPNIEVIGQLDQSGNCFIESRVHGLFACLYCIIYGLFICHKENLNGIVRLGKEHLYYHPSAGENVFEYFFKQSEATNASMTIRVNNPSPLLKWCHISTIDKKRANFMIERKLNLRDEINELIYTFKEKNFGDGNTLGVHYRGRDKKTETTLLPFDYYFEKIDEILDKGICTKFFFCTDELSLREIVQLRYKEKVIMYKLEDTTIDMALPADQGLHLISKAPHLQAKDALIETYLLSLCTLLLSSSSSSMSIFATYLNPNILHIPLER